MNKIKYNFKSIKELADHYKNDSAVTSLIKLEQTYNASKTVGDAVENIYKECHKDAALFKMIVNMYVKRRYDYSKSLKYRITLLIDFVMSNIRIKRG